METKIDDGGGVFNKISPVFYGPNGQEIGAPFSFTIGTPGEANAVQISGVALAKQQ